jgi:hypothetical protein
MPHRSLPAQGELIKRQRKKTMRAILIDPTAKAVSEVEFHGDRQALRKFFLDCLFYEAIQIDRQNYIFYGDSGVQPGSALFMLAGMGTPLAGKALVLGSGKDLTDTTLTVEQICKIVSFPNVEFAGSRPLTPEDKARFLSKHPGFTSVVGDVPIFRPNEEFLAPLTPQEKVAVCDLEPEVYEMVIKFKETGQFPGGEVKGGWFLELRGEATTLAGLDQVYGNRSRGGVGTSTSGSLVDPTFGSLIELLKKLPIRDLETLVKCVLLSKQADMLGTKEPEMAAKLYQHITFLNPYDDVSRMSCGCLIARAGDLREGIAWVQEALKLNPGNQRAKKNLQAMTAALVAHL